MYSLAYEDFLYSQKNLEQRRRAAIQPLLGLPGTANAAVAHTEIMNKDYPVDDNIFPHGCILFFTAV
jgi:hypothetical protein